jgi:ATP-dependent DNA ligase
MFHYTNYYGGGNCQLCGAPKSNKATCPLNKLRKTGTKPHKLGLLGYELASARARAVKKKVSPMARVRSPATGDKRCKGVKKDGTQCTRSHKGLSKYCKSHETKPMSSDVEHMTDSPVVKQKSPNKLGKKVKIRIKPRPIEHKGTYVPKTSAPAWLKLNLHGSCRNGNTGTIQFSDNVLLAKELILKDGSMAANPVGWWASEKFDGYRALWNGKEFLSRNGNKYEVPVWFSALMPPDIALDGELWMGRCKFNECGLFRKKVPIDKEWLDGQVKYTVFDMPGINEPFEKRMLLLHGVVSDRCKCTASLNLPLAGKFNIRCPITVTKHTQIKSLEELHSMFKTVTDAGGEGVMIRQPGSMYEPKRSSTLLKMKVTFDTECRIVGYKNGTGKYKGLLGSFECKLIKGSKQPFHVAGMNDVIRHNYMSSHPIDTIITIQYNDVSNHGIPRHPRYLRKRDDYELSKS